MHEHSQAQTVPQSASGQYLKLTVKKKYGIYTVRITDENNKVHASYETEDLKDANGTADLMIEQNLKYGVVVHDRRVLLTRDKQKIITWGNGMVLVQDRPDCFTEYK